MKPASNDKFRTITIRTTLACLLLIRLLSSTCSFSAAFAQDASNATGAQRYIRPLGSGNHSGTDFGNAADLHELDEMIRLAGPGGTVYLLADAGQYSVNEPINIAHGGTADNSVTIKGIDSAGKPANALIAGNRTSPYPTDAGAFAKMNHSNEVFRLNSGADHLSFSSLSFRDIGNGAFFVRSKISNLTLKDMTAKNIRRFLERSPDTDSTINALAIRRVVVEGYSKSVIRLDYNTSKVLIEDVQGDSMRQDFDNFTEGIDLSGSVHDVLIRRCTMRNSQQTLGPEDFWNGDGFTTELDTHDIVFEDCVASGNTDAGFDLKSNRVTLLRCKSYDNTANFKLWGKSDVVMRDCSSDAPLAHGAQPARHVLAPAGARVLVERCHFTDKNRDAVVYYTEANDDVDPPIGATITSTGCSVRSLGKLSFVDFDSKIFIDGLARPYDGR